MKQTARIISTYSADVMGVCSALFELGGMVVMHDASGCNSTYTTHDEPRWYDMDSMVYISGISEMEAIMGDDEKLIEDICDAAKELHPKFIAIAGTPIPAMTGFDFEAVASVIEQRTSILSFGFPTTGMNTYIHGASMAFRGLAERFVAAPNAKKKTGHQSQKKGRIKVNVIGLTPLDFSVNGQAESIRRWLEESGCEVLSCWAMGSSLDEIKHAGEADVNLVVSAAGFEAAKVLNERFGIPFAVGVPVGNELSALMADDIKMKAAAYRSGEIEGIADGSFKVAEISDTSGGFQSGIGGESGFSGGFQSGIGGESGRGGRSYKRGFAAVIGEGVMSLSVASAIEARFGIPAKVLCATECPEGILRSCDRMTPDEDDIIPELEGADYVIADPLYKPIVPESTEFIPLPSEAFSGRIYRDDIPDLIGNEKDFFKIFYMNT